MKTEKSLRVRAMEQLARREMSQWELKRKLAPYAKSEEELNQVIEEFAQKNWQSDQRYTELFINSRSRKHGRLRLQQDLMAKGINQELIHSYLPDHDTELSRAQDVWQKKFKNSPKDFSEKQKHIRFLLYRGFSMDIALKVIQSDWDEPFNNDDDFYDN